MPAYSLAEHVFACVDGEQVVLLDIRADRYWALEAAQAAGLAAWIDGWPVQALTNVPGAGHHATAGSDGQVPAPPADIGPAIEVLRGRGLLTHASKRGRATAAIPTIATPTAELSCEPRGAQGRSLRKLMSFLLAVAYAKAALRFLPLERVISRIRRRKRLSANAMDGPGALPMDLSGASSSRNRDTLPDFDHARRLVEAFLGYRIFLFSVRNECLYDSLALLEFLARHGIYPDWVFAVRSRPFTAHCWVQHEGVVFNDTVEHVRSFTPIMIV